MKTIVITAFIILNMTVFAQISTEKIDDIVENEMIRQHLPGLAVGVYENGTINYTKGYGFMDVNNTIPITNNTVLEWASISKTITAVSLFQLLETNSTMSVDDFVTDHYEHWTSDFNKSTITHKKWKDKITLKHLLNHRSGINHYTRGWADERNQYPYNKKMYKSNNGKYNADLSVDVFRTAYLDFRPGHGNLYTSFGYNLLGAVIDEKAGNYENWVNSKIKNKLGLSSLRIAKGGFKGFQKRKDGILNGRTSTSYEWVLPSGGWESNIKDLLKFARGISEGTLLNNTSLLWTENATSNQKKYHGLESEGSGESLRVWHGGTHTNLKSLMYILPNKNIAVVVMIPVQYSDAWNVVKPIINEMGISRTFATTPKDNCGKGMGSSSIKYVGVWQKTNKDVIVRRGYTTENFNTEWNFLTSKGYHLENIEYSNKKWNGVFKKGTGTYAMWRNFNQDDFNAKWKDMNAKGFRLYDLETYTINGKRKWAGLFKKGAGRYAMFRNYTTTDFATKREELAKDGFKLIDIEVYNSSNGLKWSGVWIEGVDGKLNRNYTEDEFKALITTRASQGYKLIDVETYSVNGNRKWAGIWEKNNQDQHVSFGENYCDFMDLHTNYSHNYELIDIINYN